MTDKELLGMAAKAAGIVGHWIDEPICGIVEPVVNGCDVPWNPLWNSGQALELAVKLDLLSGPEFWRERSIQYAMAAFSGDRQDPYAATRRAIVRAAAEIGKAINA